MHPPKLKLAVLIFAVMTLPAAAQNAPGAPGASAGVDAAPVFTAVDTNKDGKMSLEEWKTAGLNAEMFNFFDEGKKSYVTMEAWSSVSHPDDTDADKDGKVSLDEMVTYQKANIPPTTGGNSGAGASDVPAAQGAAPGGPA